MKLGFIGTGNMAGAIMGGIIKKGIIAPEEIIGCLLYTSCDRCCLADVCKKVGV